MKSSQVIIVFAAILFGFSLLVLGLWRHKRASAGDVKLLGEIGRVETSLNPLGTIIVAGELWNAQSSDGRAIEINTRVRVVGVKGLLAVVDSLGHSSLHVEQ